MTACKKRRKVQQMPRQPIHRLLIKNKCAGNVPTKQETQDKRSGVEGSGTEEIPAFTPEESAAFELAVGDFAAAMAMDNITMKAIKEHFRKRSGKQPGEGDSVFLCDEVQRSRF